MKIKWERLAPLFPAFVSVAIVTVLAEFHIIEFSFSIHDLDTFIVLFGLLVTIVITSVILSREAVRRMQSYSLQQARTESQAEHVRFLRRLDHELKNPLMGIKVAVSNLSQIEDPYEQQQIRSAIETQIVRMSRLVAELRKLADLESQPLERLPVDLAGLLHEVYTLACDETPDRARDMRLSLPPEGLPVVFGDHDLLLVALYNLMNNALKFTRQGDRVELRASVQETVVSIAVHDTGQGIAPDDLRYVWDELFRTQTVKDIPGSGIGLSLVKLIAERHNGKVHIQSQLGGGTAVGIDLPTSPPMVESASGVTGS